MTPGDVTDQPLTAGLRAPDKVHARQRGMGMRPGAGLPSSRVSPRVPRDDGCGWP
jgi:hypothetical protein